MLLCTTALVSATLALSAAQPSTEVLFPTPQASIVLDGGGEGMNYDQLVQSFGRATGLELLLAPGLRHELSQWQVDVVNPIEVAPEHVYAVVESLLVDYDLTLVPIGNTGMFQLRRTAGPQGPFIAVENLASYVDHPALVLWTVVHLEHVDARQLTNSLRSLLTDSQTQAAIPVGNTNALILRGRAPQLAALAESLLHINKLAGQVSPQAPAKAPVEEAPTAEPGTSDRR